MTNAALRLIADAALRDDFQYRTPRGTATFDDLRAGRMCVREPDLAHAVIRLLDEIELQKGGTT